MMNTSQGSAISQALSRWPILLMAAMMLCALASGTAAENALGIPDSEYDALVALYNATDGPNWTDNTNWLTANTPWYGVTVEAGHVVWISLGNNNLEGFIPAEIGDLPYLRCLNLDSNQLTGGIPTEIGSLANLKGIDLCCNQLTGEIPAEIGNLSNLEFLDLGANRLSGPIPVEMGNLTNLRGLCLNTNQLTGPIPPEMGAMSNLSYLHLDNNQLTGPIPWEIGYLWDLESLHLSSNQIDGPIPPGIFDMGSLQFLDLGENQLSGPIPRPDLWFLSSLCYLNLGNNQLSGQIPAEIADLEDLEALILSSNQLSGPIPSGIANMPRLRYLDLGKNQLSGSIPSGIGNLNGLLALGLNDNMLTGPIPPELGNLTELVLLWLQGNQLTGDIPDSIANLVHIGDFPEPPEEPFDPSSISYGALWSTDPAVQSFLDEKFPGWELTQTVPPTDVSAEVAQSGPVVVSWTPIPYTGDGGYYEVGVSIRPGGPYIWSERNRTSSKSVSSMTLVDVPSASNLYFVVRTFTPAGPHNQSSLTSPLSPEVSANGSGLGMTIGEAKLLSDGETVVIPIMPAVMGWLETPETIKAYIEQWDRSSGIAIRLPATMAPDGESVVAVSLTGTMATRDGERYIDVSSIEFFYGDGHLIRPLGIANLTGARGHDLTGMYIKTWGRVIEAPAYSAGVHPNSFRMSDASGEFTALWPYGYDGLLVPTIDSFISVKGVCSGIPGEKTLYYDPDYELGSLGSWNIGSGHYDAWAFIYENRGHATLVEVSGPGIDEWTDMEYVNGRWQANWLLPDPLPATPVEYLFRFTDSSGANTFRGWITGYMPTYPLNMSPAQDSTVTGPLTFSWSLPSAGAPFKSIITLYSSTGYPWEVRGIEGSSYTYDGPQIWDTTLWWTLRVYDRDGNGITSETVSFQYDPGPPPSPSEAP